jgi:hypothetical protein
VAWLCILMGRIDMAAFSQFGLRLTRRWERTLTFQLYVSAFQDRFRPPGERAEGTPPEKMMPPERITVKERTSI